MSLIDALAVDKGNSRANRPIHECASDKISGGWWSTFEIKGICSECFIGSISPEIERNWGLLRYLSQGNWDFRANCFLPITYKGVREH
jgi:hypothetical protein